MPTWTTPPTFTASSILSAAQLNVLSDDLEVLYGYVGGANPSIAAQGTTGGNVYYIIRHQQRYLHLSYKSNDDVKVYYDATEVFHDGSPSGSQETPSPVDLNSFGFTVGQLYTIKVSLSGSGTNYIYYLYESNT